MRTIAATAAFLLATVGAQGAFADFQYAASTTNSGSIANGSLGGTQNNAEGAPNGSLLTLTITADGTAVLRLRVAFTNPVDNPGIMLYGVSVSSGATATITQLRWSNNGTNPGDTDKSVDSNNITVGSPLTVTNGTFYFTDGFDQFTSSGATAVSGFSAGTFTHAFIRFQVTGLAGDTLQIDAISNPEPGTAALFALGVGGLGVFAVRRRRNAGRKRDGR